MTLENQCILITGTFFPLAVLVILRILVVLVWKSKVECCFCTDPVFVDGFPHCQHKQLPLHQCYSDKCTGRRIRFSLGLDMVNTLMTNYINVENHPSHTLHTHTHPHAHTHIHTLRPILSQCPQGRSFVCVYGLKCCWQVKINPTLLFPFPAPFLAVHFFLPLPLPVICFHHSYNPAFPFCSFVLSSSCLLVLSLYIYPTMPYIHICVYAVWPSPPSPVRVMGP